MNATSNCMGGLNWILFDTHPLFVVLFERQPHGDVESEVIDVVVTVLFAAQAVS